MPTLVEALRRPSNETRDRPTLTVLGGSQIGSVLSLSGENLILGRGVEATVHFDDASVSRRHARVFRAGHDVYIEDLGSALGTFVRGRKIDAPTRLEDGDRIELGPVRKLQYGTLGASEEEAARELYRTTVRDPSGAFNRRHFDTSFAREATLAARHGRSMVLLLLDVDELKTINDSHGHGAGDLILTLVAATVQRLLRPSDLLVRYGGDEFVVMCPGTTLRNGIILGERIRAGIEALTLTTAGGDVRVTVSVGVASTTGDCEQAELVSEADRALYSAKRGGRNRVVS